MARSFRLIATSALLAALAVLASAGMSAQGNQPASGAASAPQAAPARPAQDWATAPSSERTFKVRLDFNRWHDVAELQADMRTLEKAYPKFLKYVSLGKSYGGRDIAAMIINNPDTGADTAKPAMYIEANIHGNEIQGGEVCIYTILVPDGALREDRRRHAPRRRARVLHRAHGQSRTAATSSCGAPAATPARATCPSTMTTTTSSTRTVRRI